MIDEETTNLLFEFIDGLDELVDVELVNMICAVHYRDEHSNTEVAYLTLPFQRGVDNEALILDVLRAELRR